jgi:hypothetical protein
MMRRCVLRALAASTLLLAGAALAEGESSLKLQTRFRQTLALEFDDARVQKLEIEALPRLEATLPLGFELTSIARLRIEPLDRLEPGRPDQSTYFPPTERLLVGEVAEIELRELFVERDFDVAHLTLGKQQVVWGRADGIKVLDVVNPQSFREFILPPFDESRIPLWTANLEVPIGPASAQLLWIPDPTVHDLPEQGAPYEITSSTLVPTPPPFVGVEVERARRPDDFFRDSDAGLRLSGNLRGWDLTLNYLYHYDDVPLLHRRLRVDPSGFTAVITPDYARTHVAGFTIATSWRDFTLRGEAAAFTDRYVPTNDVLDTDGVLHEQEYAYVLGIDWFGLAANTFASVQLQQSFVPGLPSTAVRNDLQQVVTLLLRREFADSAGVAQAMLLLDPDRGDGLVRGRVRYELTNGIGIAIGADVFFGADSGIFGEFRDRSRLVLELEETL